ncbi:protein kinase [Paludicola sp. MB14-C6]|uniref:protein kinase domain-containing protein n=1 Tax=Paludihabitans sp. MB14-C6 TaxID=3070656 RepID=UPI0027DD162D|nr:PASTA domain-containing protein [Paludicola sp. MB14-C6]WMJ22383.1 protein kinase [Paludicola sp. MB14-C6]
MDQYIGKKLEGRYELLELIGFGGMAIVFKAKDIKEDRFVAIKILKDEYLQNDDFKRRFRNESKAIAVLSHPSIVKVYDVNFSDNIQYIVMEYIDGITLKEYIEQQGTVKWKEAVHFTVQILRALQHAHDNGIVHRDVKPQNVMLLEDGTIKVMDFGIARFARENGKTLSDKAIGSVHYISPEQAKGEITDERTDIYATGVILYEMLTGKVPFDGDTPVSIAIKQMQIEPTHPTAINGEIPTGLEEIILRAMQKDPQLRYQTAAEMLRDIDEFKHNPSVVFEYKYFNSDGTTKYFNKLDVKGKKIPEPVKKSHTMSILAGVACTCVLLLCVAAFFFFKSLGNKRNDVVVLNIVGMTIEDAQKAMKDVKIVEVSKENSPEYDAGIIIKQTPDKDSKVKVGSEIKVVVSSGFQLIKVPDLVNEKSTIAKSKLEALGFEVKSINKTDKTIVEGNVIGTDPEAGKQMKKGDIINLYISTGTPILPITVPNLKGSTEAEARSKLLQLGLKLGKVESVNSSEKLGTIVEQSVKEGEKLEKDSTVDVKVSNGSEASSSITIPVDFPKNSNNKDYIFDIYVNGQKLDSKITNPATVSRMPIELTASENKINGKIDVSPKNEVTIMVDGQMFAKYEVDFTAKTVKTVQKQNNALISSQVGGDQQKPVQ